MSKVTASPPRAPPIKYAAPLGTRWAKEKAAAGGARAFDLPTDPHIIGPWILGECVGKGASGRVKIAKHRRTGQLAAIKILPIAPLVNSRNSLDKQQAKSEKQRLGIDREITMMKLMNHPNIMRIYDVYEGERELFLVLEYVEGGELFDFLVNRGRLPPQEALEYFKQIIYGLNYAHTFSIIHRDLKPENILIASLSPPLLKIADWGMAAFAPPSLQLETSCGSPHYASPEIVNGERYQGNATDIWSCGVILYALLTGRLPFDDKNVRTLLAKVKSGKYDMPAWIDPLAKDLLSRMLVVDVASRITIPEILSHPWLMNSASASVQTKEGKSIKRPDPPLPPSPSTLARPLASPSLIDPELFSSLRIIWGRHTDSKGESIKRDLCSPAGQGVHAKAFYFLLNKYREDTILQRLKDGESAEDDHENNGINALRFDRSWHLDSFDTSQMKKPNNHRHSNTREASPLKEKRPLVTSAPGSVAPLPRRFAALPPLMDRTGNVVTSRDRPSSPAGSRPIRSPQHAPCKVAEHHQSHHHSYTCPVAPVRPTTSSGPQSHILNAGKRPQPRRGHTFSHPVGNKSPIENVLDAHHSAYPEARHRAVIVPFEKDEIERRRIQFPETRIPSPTFQGDNFQAPSPVERHQKVVPVSRSSTSALPPCNPRHIQSRVREHAVGASENSRRQLDSGPSTTPKPPSGQVVQSTNQAPNQAMNDAVKAKSTTGMGGTAHVPGYSKAIRRDYDRQDHGQRRTPSCLHMVSGDKENQAVVADDFGLGGGAARQDRRASGVGLGLGHSREVGQEMSNVLYIGTGSTPAAKGKKEKEKEKKGRPPALEVPVRRSTLAALGSPITLSSTATSPSHLASPTRLLTSPVVGEFKEWFTSLFHWKSGGGNGSASAQNMVLYSPDDVLKTCEDIGRLLESLGVIIVFEVFTEPNEAQNYGEPAKAGRLKCRVEELSVDAQANISLKPVRFRVEFTPVPEARPQVRHTVWSPPLSPIADNACFFLPPSPAEESCAGSGNRLTTTMPMLAAPNPGVTPRVRMSMLPVMMRGSSSGQNTPMPSPYLSEMQVDVSLGSNGNGDGIPHGSACAILLIYEKGSMTSFRTIWKKVKEYYCDVSSKMLSGVQGERGVFSPLMVSTPIAQDCTTGQFH